MKSIVVRLVGGLLVVLLSFLGTLYLIDNFPREAAPQPGSRSSQLNGLVGYWPLNEGSGNTAADQSGNGRSLTLRNKPAWIAGKIGSALLLNGTNQHAETTPWNDPRLNFTWAGWFRPSIAMNELMGPSRVVLMSSFIDAQNYDQLYFQKEDSTLSFSIGAKGTFTRTIAHYLHLQPNTWYHLAITRSGDAWAVYVFGVNDTITRNGTPSVAGARVTRIGSDGISSYWPGAIDDIRIYNRALTPAEVKALVQ